VDLGPAAQRRQAFVMEWTVIEQRKTQRFDLALPFEVVRSGTEQTTAGETKNVSSAGVLFTSAIPIRIGESIEYFITLPRVPGSRMEVRLRCSGTVVREEDKLTFAATLERHEFRRTSEAAGI
jgi:hypothetical protein